MKAAFALLGPIVAVISAPAVAAVDFTLSYAPVTYFGSNSGTFVFDTTVLNTGTENITGYDGNASYSFGDLAPYFVDARFGPTSNHSDFVNQFAGLNLAPGSSFTFTLGNFTYSGAPDGVYNIGGAEIGLRGVSGQGVTRSANNVAQLRIGAPAVPEPATWAMMLIGFGAVGGAMRSAKRRQKMTIFYA